MPPHSSLLLVGLAIVLLALAWHGSIGDRVRLAAWLVGRRARSWWRGVQRVARGTFWWVVCAAVGLLVDRR